MSVALEQTLVEREEALARAIVAADVAAIGGMLTDDWVLIGPDGELIERATFLAVIAAGDLVHETMTFDDWRVRTYGDGAVATSVAVTSGNYKGQPMRARERSTSVYVRQDGTWRCALTHLTSLAED